MVLYKMGLEVGAGKLQRAAGARFGVKQVK